MSIQTIPLAVESADSDAKAWADPVVPQSPAAGKIRS